MIYPIVSPEDWSQTNKLDIVTEECPKCGIDRVFNIPFADGKIRGFISDTCKCGANPMQTFIVKDEYFNKITVELL